MGDINEITMKPVKIRNAIVKPRTSISKILRLPASPPSFYIPRIKDFKDAKEIIDCWRYGKVGSRIIIPLHKLRTGSQRAELWEGCTDAWWKASNSKEAFARIRRIVQKVVSFSEKKCTMDNIGSDHDWKIALEQESMITKSVSYTLLAISVVGNSGDRRKSFQGQRRTEIASALNELKKGSPSTAMHHSTIARRRAQNLAMAVDSVRKKALSVRAAAERYHLPKSTIQENVSRLGPLPSPPRRTALRDDEEDLFASFFCSTRAWACLSPHDTCVTPYRSWSRRCRPPVKPEFLSKMGARAPKNLTTHFATLAMLFDKFGFDAQRVWNLDETGATPDKDVNGRSSCRRFLDRRGLQDLKIAEFRRTHRVTMLPAISAAGSVAPPLFVFKGKKIPYREVLLGGKAVVQTYADLLPRHSLLACREDRGSVDSVNFFNWAKVFVESVRDLTAGGCKVLLIYDAYRSHMSLNVLNLFRQNGIVVYALQAHTSGKTQPLDVVVFSAFKNALNESLNAAASSDCLDVYDTFDFCGMLSSAFRKYFTPENVISSFRRSGIWPLDSSKLLSSPCPASEAEIYRVLTPIDLQRLLEVNLRAARTAVLGDDAVLLTNGFIDTRQGAVVPSDRALQLTTLKSSQDKKQRARKEREANRRAVMEHGGTKSGLLKPKCDRYVSGAPLPANEQCKRHEQPCFSAQPRCCRLDDSVSDVIRRDEPVEHRRLFSAFAATPPRLPLMTYAQVRARSTPAATRRTRMFLRHP
eukprot:IDg6015t1